MDLEFIHMMNELLEKYPPKDHLKIIQEMVHMECEAEKKDHLKRFFAYKLEMSRLSLKEVLIERGSLPRGIMNKDLNS